MKIIQKILSMLIKLIIIIWSVISLFLLSLISIVIYFIFKFQAWFLKRKFKNLTQNFKIHNNVKFKETKVDQNNSEVKVSVNKDSSKNFTPVKTINRKLKTKDGEIL